MTKNARRVLEDLAHRWEQQAADIHDENANPDDMSDFGRARWFALRECAQELYAKLRAVDDFTIVEPAGLASPDELRTALAHYGKHTPYVCALDAHASARHSGCTCGLTNTIDGGPVTEHVRSLVGVCGLGTEIPAAVRDPEQMLLARLRYLTQIDTAHLLVEKKIEEGQPKTPALYASGVKLRAGSGFEQLDIPTVLQRGGADIDALACWRAAELQVAGTAAEPILVRIQREWGKLYTCRVRLPNGEIEDVQEKLL